MRTKHRENLNLTRSATAFAQALADERARWPLWAPVALGSGVAGYFLLPFEPPLWMGWAAALTLGWAAWACFVRGRALAGFAVALFALAALGLGLAGFSAWRAQAPMLAQDIVAARLSGQILTVESVTRGLRVTLGAVSVARLAPDRMPKRVRVTLAGPQPGIRAGDWITVLADLSAPSPPVVPGAFDFQRQSYFEGIGAIGFSYGRARVIGAGPATGPDGAAFALDALRHDIDRRIQARLGGDTGNRDRAAVASALMTGLRGEISDAANEAMRASGLAHLLSISGLHVGLVAGIVMFVVRAGLALAGPAALRHPVKKWAAAAALLAAFGYSLLAGWTVPTQRSFLMAAVMLLAVIVERRALTLRTVALAAMAILVVAPEALLGPSFQMSFAAVIALVAAFEVLSAKPWFQARRVGFWGRIGRYGLGVAVSTLVAGSATWPFAAYHFNRVADFGLAANMIAVPLTALWIMPWTVAAFALMPLGWEGRALDALGLGVQGVLWVAETVAAWPGAQVSVAAFPAWALGGMVLGGLWLALWSGPWRRWGALVALAGLAGVHMARVPDVWIDASGRLAAVKTPEGGLSVSSLTRQRFERDVWLRRAGLVGPDSRWTDAQPVSALQGAGAWMRCDALGCLYAPDGGGGAGARVAFTAKSEALAEDCRQARVVVDLSGTLESDRKGDGCPAPLVIGLKDLDRKGAHVLYMEAGGWIRIETVAGTRGRRPWTQP